MEALKSCSVRRDSMIKDHKVDPPILVQAGEDQIAFAEKDSKYPGA